MERDVDLLAHEISQPNIRASVTGLNAALAVTSDALVIADARSCGLQRRVRRYPLRTVSAVRFLEDCDGSLLALEFNSGERRAVLFPSYTTCTAKRLLSELDSEVKKVVECNSEETASQH